MIEVKSLHKRMGQRLVFRRLDFEWKTPGVICVCGPNGCGKTTLLSMLAGAVAPDAGEILIMGRSLVSEHEEASRFVSYVPDDCPVYDFITGNEWLEFTRSVRGGSARSGRELAVRFGLEPHFDSSFGTMSLGTAKKFLLVSALARDKPVLILDEPTNGLDSAALDVLGDCLEQRMSQGLVVMSCHDVSQRRRLGAREAALLTLEAA